MLSKYSNGNYRCNFRALWNYVYNFFNFYWRFNKFNLCNNGLCVYNNDDNYCPIYVCFLDFFHFNNENKKWLRPIFYQTFSKEVDQPKSQTIEKALSQCAKDETTLIIDLLKKVAFSLTVNLDNNQKMSKFIKIGFYFIIFGLISFISSIIVLIIVAINII